MDRLVAVEEFLGKLGRRDIAQALLNARLIEQSNESVEQAALAWAHVGRLVALDAPESSEAFIPPRGVRLPWGW